MLRCLKLMLGTYRGLISVEMNPQAEPRTLKVCHMMSRVLSGLKPCRSKLTERSLSTEFFGPRQKSYQQPVPRTPSLAPSLPCFPTKTLHPTTPIPPTFQKPSMHVQIDSCEPDSRTDKQIQPQNRGCGFAQRRILARKNGPGAGFALKYRKRASDCTDSKPCREAKTLRIRHEPTRTIRTRTPPAANPRRKANATPNLASDLPTHPCLHRAWLTEVTCLNRGPCWNRTVCGSIGNPKP